MDIKSADHIRSYRPKPIVRKEYIEEAAKLINAAKKPFVIFGQGVILGRAEKEFKQFIEKGWHACCMDHFRDECNSN